MGKLACIGDGKNLNIREVMVHCLGTPVSKLPFSKSNTLHIQIHASSASLSINCQTHLVDIFSVPISLNARKIGSMDLLVTLVGAIEEPQLIIASNLRRDD